MIYKGTARGNVIHLEDKVTLPEGTRVSVIPEELVTHKTPEHPMTLKAWLQEARQIRAHIPQTSDSVQILRQLREERANR